VAQGAGAATGGTLVHARLTEYRIALSRRDLTPGVYMLVTTNAGSVVHALSIQGPGVNLGTGIIQPGQTVDLSVHFNAGSYDVFCPVVGPRKESMKSSEEYAIVDVTHGRNSEGKILVLIDDRQTANEMATDLRGRGCDVVVETVAQR
jgi:hypothetical protein